MNPSIFRALRLFSICVLLTSCARTCTESALSDVVLSEPELLIVEIDVDKDLSNPHSSSSSVRIFIRDKNGQALTLRDGGVAVNDKTLGLKRTLLTSLPYYSADETMVRLVDNAKYDVNVRLGDGSVYPSTLSLPKDNLTMLNIPADYSPGSDLNVTWNRLNSGYDAFLTWEKTMVRDTITQTTSDRIALSKGMSQMKFPSSFFTDKEFEVISVDFTLEVLKNGQAHKRFRPESYVRCRFYASKRVQVKQLSS